MKIEKLKNDKRTKKKKKSNVTRTQTRLQWSGKFSQIFTQCMLISLKSYQVLIFSWQQRSFAFVI